MNQGLKKYFLPGSKILAKNSGNIYNSVCVYTLGETFFIDEERVNFIQVAKLQGHLFMLDILQISL